MSATEKTINLAEKFFEQRRSMKALLSPARYAKQTADIKPYIEAGMKRWKLNHIQTALKMLKEIPEKDTRDTLIVPLVVSAVLDMMEAKS